MRERTRNPLHPQRVPSRLRGARALVLAAALPSFLTGCAVVGYPSPQRVTPAPQGQRPIEESIDVEALIVRPAPAPISTIAAPAPARAPRQYEVLGQRYTVMADAGDYTEIGIASWYGNELAGRPTASGEKYDPQGMTAAHRTLPLSTWLEVKNLGNGRTVVVRVNDRGPFAATHERIIDVSLAAARVLGLVGVGTARVEVRVVPPPTPRRF
jgi:rare lipoprotein A (peptidoglycan hydrolase)